MSEWLEGVLGVAADQKARREYATNIYDALLVRGELHAVLTYRCPDRCDVLDIVDLPEGQRLYGQRRYKTSPERTRLASSDSGRGANTEDGDHRWKLRASFEGDLSNPVLSCDHLAEVRLADEAIAADLAAGHSEVTVRSDGTRCAVR